MSRFPFLTLMVLFSASAQAAGLEVSNGWIRLLPAGVPAGGYFEVRNSGNAAAELTGVNSPAFGQTMIHRSAEDQGHSTMRHVHSVEVPPHGKTMFAPGGYHIMMMKPTRKLRIGEKVPVTLQFASDEKVTAPFEVRGPSGK